ncbi:MAG: triose-phosphate isomerase [Chloroflexi bacterium]|nr:triose-phosphate isomerase [Chloroflexota bacterium]MCL5273806.1 triose-phosphate isomerase [Chloroflexota bacterium]
MRTPFIAGNWKMNKTVGEAVVLVDELKAALAGVSGVDVAVCPPFVALTSVKTALAGSAIKLGAQNAYFEPKGAFTGEVSIGMLTSLVDYVIVGHSERRQIFGESDQLVNKKVLAVLASGMQPIMCIGETLAENEAGQTEAVLARQARDGLANVSAADITRITIAYEPIWAIGTGRAATSDDAQDRCAFVRAQVRLKYGDLADQVRIQYGGSVTPANAKELLARPDIDGALVGGASLKAADFSAIVKAAVA